MTASHTTKRKVRALVDQVDVLASAAGGTDDDRWSYQFTLRLVRTLGHEAVASALDELVAGVHSTRRPAEFLTRLRTLSRALNERARVPRAPATAPTPPPPPKEPA
jgi:hypothetical protein